MFEFMLFVKPPVAAPPDTEYFGEVQTADFIDGVSLAAALSFTNGTAVFNTEPWLKIKHQGKTLYFPKKALRHTVSWNHLNTANLIFGARTVVVKGQTFKVRLFTGSISDPYPNEVTGGEWNAIIYRLWDSNPNGTADNLAMFTRAELGMDSTARFTWCQETFDGNSANCCVRGNPNITDISNAAKSNTSSNYGWRPVLELVE